ncbi:Lrp/AsnC family transcriptional regulator [Mucilaginibacter sp. X4EP1]|uniref:Lrp/AsnC family transcriptional regulator n=1 Tax=Mucilaginibacter sp. X4EP1 TaxID=2723092 RepID=UPI0021691F4A|nr:Lrp/AsnC family transcriptional regulator [Mucilaginibacter sp. X4EP1]MCS3812426.1 Lrp/AsnC family leucine-responsive transcriptional regulator [Mucilaginibacter sp. X4EP1]
MISETAIILDKTDLHILRLMQENARISNAELARELDMAPSGMLERVKKLEQKKVILQYTTRIDPNALQQKMLAFVFMKATDGPGCYDTAKQLAKIPEVQEVHHVAGDDCYLIKVRTYDSASLMHLLRNSFGKIPNVLSTRTIIVLETSKEQQQLVIPEN